MKVVRVTATDGLAEFVELPWSIYRDDPLWVPPLREQTLFELSGASAFSRYGRFQSYLCEADGTIAGRIAALVNPRLVDQEGRAFGQLGYFECIDDPAIAAALVDEGVRWLRDQGAQTVVAPMNGGAHRTHRLMTHGFDREPYLFEPRNPPYYPALLERCGFAPISRWFGYELTAQMVAAKVEQFERVLRRRPADGTIEELPTGRSEQTILRIHRLLDRCWTGHVGYAPLDLDEFVEVFGGALAIMNHGDVSVLVQGGDDAGLAFVLPDYAPQMRALEGHAAGWGSWLGGARAKRLVMHTTALVPEVRRGSFSLTQVVWTLRRALENGYESAVAALVVEGFASTIGDQTREHRLYARRLAD